MCLAESELPKCDPVAMGGNSPNEKRKILAFNQHFLPGYRAGGPIRTLANMSDRLGSKFSFLIVTLDRDLGDSTAYTNIDPESWNRVRQAQVRYFAKRAVTVRTLHALIQEVAPDVIYLNSFFDPIFTRRILLLRWLGRISDIPVVLAPRGELSAGALDIKKAKKKLYLFLTRMLGLYRKLVWQASSEHEKADLQRLLPFIPESTIEVAKNLAPLRSGAGNLPRLRRQSEPLKVCFLARISAMKNLDYALLCLRSVKERVTFTIFGPRLDARYWASCEEIITSLPGNVTVTYNGDIPHDDVIEVLSRHDLFFLPTRGENYGHVIQEALAAGLPVLISDTTPWGGVVARGVGWELPLDRKMAFAQIIDEVAAWAPKRFEAVRYNALTYAAECAEDDDALNANKQLFIDTIARKSGDRSNVRCS